MVMPESTQVGEEAVDEEASIDSLCARIAGECRQGDRARFGELLSLTEPRVRRLIGRLSGVDDLDDLVQETYLRAWRSLASFRGESRFSTWLFRIAVNTTHTYRRSRKRLVSLPIDAEQTIPASRALDDRSLSLAYENALASLSIELRTVFVLHEAEGLAYREIAETVGCPIGTVMSRLHRARTKILDELRERLEELTP